MNENEILGFDPSQLNVFTQEDAPKSSVNPLIYRPRPVDSKSEDGVYRAKIKLIYNPFNFKESVLEQQSYGMQDKDGWFSVVSSLTANDKNCPIFKAWKKCHFADPSSTLYEQALTKDKGGKGLFDKRYARYVTIQVLEDANQPDLEGQYLFWKMPKFVWDAVNNKMAPAVETKKAAIPVMDFLFGRALYLEVTPGPGKPGDERYSRETSYSTSEISEEVVSVVNSDKSSVLNASEKAVLDKYVSAMQEVWRSRDPETRSSLIAAINADPNTVELRKIYTKVLEGIKAVCPNLTEELGYKEWDDATKERVNKWIDIVLSGNDPAGAEPSSVATVVAAAENTITTSMAPIGAATTTDDNEDDLPF